MKLKFFHSGYKYCTKMKPTPSHRHLVIVMVADHMTVLQASMSLKIITVYKHGQKLRRFFLQTYLQQLI